MANKSKSFEPQKGPKSVTIPEALAIANAMAGGKKVPIDAWAPANAHRPKVTTITLPIRSQQRTATEATFRKPAFRNAKPIT